MLDLAINATAIPWHEYLTEPPSIHHSILSTPNTKPYPITFRTPTTPGYNFEKSEPPFYTLVRNNYTHFHGMEPAQLPILVGKSDGAIRGINESGYRGEFYDRNGPIEPSYWSPNEIRFENVSEPIWLNLNRSSYWHLNGKPLPNAKLVADYDTPFEAHPDERQVVDLKIVPKGFGLSLWLSAFFGICAVALYAFDRRLRADAN